MASDFTSYLGVQFKFDSAEARADIVKLLNDLDYFEKKLKGNFDTKAITDWNNKIDTAKQGLNEFGIQVDTVTQQSYQNFRAIGQMDRITREFASGGLTSGLNGLTMFGNSLTRLAVQEGGFKNAISGLAGAFTGPAGIVLGFSALIGIIESNKDKISEFFETPLTAQEAYKNSLTSIGTEFTSAVDKVNVVKNAFDEYNKGIITGNAALKIYNEQLGEIFGSKTDINSAEEVFKNKTKDYIEASFQRALADAAGKKASEEFLKQKLIEQKSLSEYKGFVSGANLSGQIDVVNFSAINKRTAQGFKDVEINTQAEIVKLYQGIQKKAQAESDNISKQGGFNLFPDKSKKPNALEDEIALLEWDIKQTEKWANAQMKIHDKIRESARKAFTIDWADTIPQKRDMAKDDIPDWFIKQNNGVNPAEEKITKEMPLWIREDTAARSENDAMIKKQYEDSKQFSNLVAKTLTSDIMNLWAAMQQGKDIGPVIGDMFAKLAEQIAAAALQAAIFCGIMDLLGFGGAGASTSFGDIFGGLLGIGIPKGVAGNSAMTGSSFNAGAVTSAAADTNNGQFVLKGNDLVLALNRSNVSLNLRRGS